MLIIIMEYCQYGDLSYQVKQNEKVQKAFTESQIMYWLVQMLLGLKDIHSQQINHRDIKLLNVFLTKNNIVKIGDFGISK